MSDKWMNRVLKVVEWFLRPHVVALSAFAFCVCFGIYAAYWPHSSEDSSTFRPSPHVVLRAFTIIGTVLGGLMYLLMRFGPSLDKIPDDSHGVRLGRRVGHWLAASFHRVSRISK